MKIQIKWTTNKKGILMLVFVYFLTGILIKNQQSEVSALMFSLLTFFSMITFSIFSNSKKHQEVFVIMLLIITCFQNVFGALIVSYITRTEMLVLVSYNYILVCFWFAWFVIFNAHKAAVPYYYKYVFALVLLIVYILFLFFLKPTIITAFVASFRNVTCPLILFMLGIYISERTNLTVLVRFILVLGIILFVFGVLELTIFKNFWLDLNIGDLWEKKGIFYDVSTGRPYNHFSAEVILGRQRRRMVSFFAEPVNLGTFFVLSFYISWWKKKWSYMFVSLIGCVLTISKGALLGILLLGVVWSYYHFTKQSFAFVAILFGILFVGAYVGIGTSGQSMAMHIQGFTNSLYAIGINPLGTGLGRAGVYGNISLSGETASNIQESGLGVVIGQLGIVGLSIYILFFFYQLKTVFEHKSNLTLRDRIFCLSMILTYAMLIIFSESALSPNACVGFMPIIGIICGKISMDKSLS